MSQSDKYSKYDCNMGPSDFWDCDCRSCGVYKSNFNYGPTRPLLVISATHFRWHKRAFALTLVVCETVLDHKHETVSSNSLDRGPC